MASGFWSQSGASLSFPFRWTAAAADPPVEHTATHTANLSVTNPSFADAAFGADVADREIFVTVVISASSVDPGVPSSVVIGDGTPVLVHSHVSGGSSRVRVLIYRAKPTGPSGTISYTSNANRHSIAVHRVTGLLSTTPVGTNQDASSTSGITISAPVDSLAGGLVLAVLGVRSSGAATMDGGLTDDYNIGFGTVHRGIHASLETAVAGTITPSNTHGDTSHRAIAAIALR